VERSTLISVGISNRSIDTSIIRVAGVISAHIVIVTSDLGVNTSIIWITRRIVTFVRICAAVRVISDNASLSWVALSIVTFIWSNTFVGIVSVDTSLDRAA